MRTYILHILKFAHNGHQKIQLIIMIGSKSYNLIPIISYFHSIQTSAVSCDLSVCVCARVSVAYMCVCICVHMHSLCMYTSVYVH